MKALKKIWLLSSLALSLASCESAPELNTSWQEISGRDEANAANTILRRPVYRAEVPKHWTRIDPAPTESIIDSTKANCTFKIGEDIEVFVHNFPVSDETKRIPPQAQVSRWKMQFQALDPLSEQTKEETRGGFAGTYFKGEGRFRKGEDAAVMAWAMQLDQEHYRSLLSAPQTLEEEEFAKQMRADYTIKAIGPSELIAKHREEIRAFAESFELIQEIPPRL